MARNVSRIAAPSALDLGGDRGHDQERALRGEHRDDKTERETVALLGSTRNQERRMREGRDEC